MRMLCPSLLLALVLVPPAHAANTTRTIKLRFVPVAEAERVILNLRSVSAEDPKAGNANRAVFPGLIDPATGTTYQLPDPAGNGGRLGEPTGKNVRGLLPAGILAITANERQKALVVTGSRKAIEELQKLVRLVDIPRRQVRVSVRVVDVDPAALQKTFPEREMFVAQGVTAVATLDAKQQAELLGVVRETSVETTADVVNNRPLRLFWPAGKNTGEGQAALVPRVNGDSSVTLLVAMSLTETGADNLPKVHEVTALRRVDAKHAMLVVPTAASLCLLVEARVLAEDKNSKARK